MALWTCEARGTLLWERHGYCNIMSVRRVDGKQLTVWEMTESKEKSKRKSKVSSQVRNNRRPQRRGKQGHIEGGGKHYRQIIVISACVCAPRARFTGRKSICTTNSVQSGNTTECTLHIYSISRALLIARPWSSHSNNSRWLNLSNLERNKQCECQADCIQGN